ncbi:MULTISPECIES: alpha/beta fold hydrolase [Nocardiopsis]|uniref:Alpha/beta hydrolase fold protein n=1 Tax=Nocardiopsis dassonvillei (strain ATCC 23218 / DSM 43111 / CIP 107115 / JCM 7437 / KCTC 9190 / NBRC 14626 / NCTC 10488 / NRRL B-5397 / IMRU 509) TaxID=446468 RepID=D7AWN1_NOCDD|nr:MULTISPECIES: alpha/beta hydrolase [Nocardiopsis]ADH67828.1 alpha/beta hydrolase fold protein [Nocardiopsis dassonvillei subsp. dassonvillei DSM 43111]APC35994.1 alpha/beta hydrolase [Nocardiopsis dassonvillei]ASU58900.1 alpha/beta hydrolase [Nocardiopsis dassonvillei]NKY81598.1 alpha/beta hydrolase [Nocardiopsis dassonvillei]VEI88328.1 Non-haem bromoperoxidase BPO-A1 [Nocardiopsis dassonvillei]
MAYVTTRDGVEIFYKDWGSGRPVVFIHGWPLNADAWEDQMKWVADNGFRGLAHDRRGHGRSGQPWSGYDFDTFADDLNDLMNHLDLQDVTLVAHSMGGGELARYIGRHGTRRVRQAVLLSAVPPIMVRSDTNPEGVPEEVLTGIKDGIIRERSQFWRETAEGFFGANRPGNKVTQGNKDAFWFMAMHQSIEAGVRCVDAFGYTDFTDDLRRFDVPTLVVHGDDDQVVPIDATGRKSARIIPDATLKVYEGGSHGIALVPGDKERFNQDLLEFLKS